MSYDGTNGAEFIITTSQAPTISSEKYIMFGKVTVTTRASAGTGIVSSFILESDDLDEIDWEWLGSTDSSVESNFFGKGNSKLNLPDFGLKNHSWELRKSPRNLY